jgi:protein ImuB
MERVSRYACVRVPFFAAAAAERAEPVLREHPLAVVAGTPPMTRVIEANAAARAAGVIPGIADAEAGAHCRGLARRFVSEEAVASARHALLTAALAVSPRVGDVALGVVDVDIAGLGRLFGDTEAIARRLTREAWGVGLVARVGVAATRTAARIAAATASGLPRMIPPGGERELLAATPIAALEIPDALVLTLTRWGVETLGDLAALPREELAMRVGEEGLRAHDLACGLDREPFHLYVPPPYWEEAQGLDWDLDSLPTLITAVEGVLARLCARLDTAHLAADTLAVRLRLATGGRHDRSVALAVPMYEPTPMLSLLRLTLETQPPPAAVVAVALEAQPVARRPQSGGLWDPAPPSLRDLATVLARLASLVGADNVGTPRLVDSHHHDPITLEPLVAAGTESGRERESARGGRTPFLRAVERGSREGGSLPPGSARARPESTLALRRLRPPRPIVVEVVGDRPATVDLGTPVASGPRLRVVACAGPWRGSGEWWDARAWARDEWDAALSDHTLCRLSWDRVAGAWSLDGVYD